MNEVNGSSSSAAAKSRREFTRVPVKLQAELTTGGRVLIKGELDDVSLNGIYLRCHGSVPVDTQCRISVILDGGKGAHCIQAQGHVSRVDDEGMAIQFSEILGEESLGHLKNLVLLNSHDQVPAVEQEIREHVGIKPV